MAEQKMLYDVVIHSRDNLRLQISIPTDYKESLEELSSRDIRIQEYKDGQLLDYQVTGETFSGVRYDAYSVVVKAVSHLFKTAYGTDSLAFSGSHSETVTCCALL